MNAVIGAGFSLLRGAGSPLLVLGLLVSVAARLPAGTVLPLKPEFRVVDMAEVIPPRREQVLAGDLQALFENEKISIHVVMLGNKPDIMLNQIARHLNESGIDDADAIRAELAVFRAMLIGVRS